MTKYSGPRSWAKLEDAGKPTPYNTGKVLIGKDHVASSTEAISPDMYEVQSAMLSKPKPTSTIDWVFRVVVVAAVLVVWLDLSVWRP
tara:strand:+ start:388 stop:648 length:261 start_codon:yes stop_codon:yes gene_type:complete